MIERETSSNPVVEQWDWQLSALCRNIDCTIFFAADDERGAQRVMHERIAKAVCARCPVVADCRRHALRAREPFGVWGGMTASERRTKLAQRVAA
jgi:WhiB family redox-sensing transcriptional regulator